MNEQLAAQQLSTMLCSLLYISEELYLILDISGKVRN